MNSIQPEIIYRKDYKKPDYLIPEVKLTFQLHDTETKVKAEMHVIYNGDGNKRPPLVLNAEKIDLFNLEIDGETVSKQYFSQDEEFVTIESVPADFKLTVENRINPEANRALEGLYKSGGIFCTQNEPEGFRRIIPFIDRPDVMSIYTTTIIALKEECPVMLSNGNPSDEKDLDDGRHSITWKDPYPKPSYLFALVAGDLGVIEDKFVTMNGREIDLRIYCDPGNEPRCIHAMESLKKAMKWDEERFGLEYDLDIYMIVAVDAFNMGAMENKGLNIFNSHYVLADSKSATDADFMGIESVIGHEYFHNWTGNRVTCRDWFQLTLKEGLTVFRDQEFSRDMQSGSVKRIEDVINLRARQFVEDAGPMAHPIRPDSYMEINNFYTMTVYEKGAEVIRMIHTILGEELFQKGMKRYFEKHDGQAVTCDDFVNAMQEASGVDFTHFGLWYEQAGTPVVKILTDYNETEKMLKISASQKIPDTPGQENKKPVHIPLALGLLGGNGEDILKTDDGNTLMINLKENEQEFIIPDVNEKPVLSINRNFSAPVNILSEQSIEDRLFLFANDSDDFNRWDAGQEVSRFYLKQIVDDIQNRREVKIDSQFLEAFGSIIADESLDPAFKSLALMLPPESILEQDYIPIDFNAIHHGRNILKKAIASSYSEDFLRIYYENRDEVTGETSRQAIGRRELVRICMSYLAETREKEMNDLCYNHFLKAGNMTDAMGALSALNNHQSWEREQALRKFYDAWKKNLLVMTKWLSLEASSPVKNTVDRVRTLETDPVFKITIPNLVRALVGSFCRNSVHFHNLEGTGYRYVADKIIEIDGFNPSIASSLAGAFRLFPKVDEQRKELIKAQLERILSVKNISKNTYEIVYKTLQ